MDQDFEMFADETHALLTVEFAQKIAGLFGHDCSELTDIYETSTEPGAYHGPTAEGVASFLLSHWLCDRLELEHTHFHGRGSQHRHCCEILRGKL